MNQNRDLWKYNGKRSIPALFPFLLDEIAIEQTRYRYVLALPAAWAGQRAGFFVVAADMERSGRLAIEIAVLKRAEQSWSWMRLTPDWLCAQARACVRPCAADRSTSSPGGPLELLGRPKRHDRGACGASAAGPPFFSAIGSERSKLPVERFQSRDEALDPSEASAARSRTQSCDADGPAHEGDREARAASPERTIPFRGKAAIHPWARSSG
jgi:hypothetical protein